jgi:hypothetical protein
MGQYCITFGYRYVTAVEGGIISSSRILLAATLGPFIASDPFLDLKGWLGAGLIFMVNAALAWRKSISGRSMAQNNNLARSRTRQKRDAMGVIQPSMHPAFIGLPARIKSGRREMSAKARLRSKRNVSKSAVEEKKMKIIRQADRQDRDQINALRIKEFQRSAQFTLLQPEKLEWNHCDDTSIVLSAWDGPRAVATMRAVLVRDTAQAESCVQCTVPSQTDFPAMVFNNAATHWDYRGIGLNQLLRYYFLKMAMDYEIQSLISPIYESAPRIQFMIDLGYQFTIPLLSWQKKLKPRTTRILGILTGSKMPQAIDLIEKQRHKIIQSYSWKGRPIQFSQSLFN